jgi:hypothetical protein
MMASLASVERGEDGRKKDIEKRLTDVSQVLLNRRSILIESRFSVWSSGSQTTARRRTIWTPAHSLGSHFFNDFIKFGTPALASARPSNSSCSTTPKS